MARSASGEPPLSGIYLRLRDGVWHYRRRVPADVAHLDPRDAVRRSTRQRAYAEAVVIANRINAEAEAFWRELSEAGPGSALASPDRSTAQFDRAVRLARTLGVKYRAAQDLARGDLSDLVRRLELLEQRHLVQSPAAAAAVLGGAGKPGLMVSRLFEIYAEHARDKLRGKSPDQVRKWRNPRLRAATNFVAVVGDRLLPDITRDDALDFRAWWLDRVIDEGLDPGSGNKDLGHMAGMFGALNDDWRLGLDNPFSGLRLAGEHHNKRIAYEPEFVRDKILAAAAVGGMNEEALGITQIVAALGMRPSEVVELDGPRILLDVSLPLVQVRPERRQLKNRYSARDMPLVGRAHDVMRRFPDGFPRYRGRPDALSATVNKALGAAGLRPTPEHTLYSLRHTFKDRLIALEAPQRVQDALMGHAA